MYDRLDRRYGSRRRRRRNAFLLVLAVTLLLLSGMIAAVCGVIQNTGTQNIEKKLESEQKNNAGEETGVGEKPDSEISYKTDGLAICMYHFLYDEADPPDNLGYYYIEIQTLESELQYLAENDYYFPTWQEVKDYVNGDLRLPEKSVVLTFDDGSESFLELGIPLLEKYQIPATAFLITGSDGERKVREYQSRYVTFESHSDRLHQDVGRHGEGGIFSDMSYEDILSDMKRSIDICGNRDAFAYPYGDYTDSCLMAVRDAGFTCAVTTENRRAEVGDDPLRLPRLRMLREQTLEDFISMVE